MRYVKQFSCVADDGYIYELFAENHLKQWVVHNWKHHHFAIPFDREETSWKSIYYTDGNVDHIEYPTDNPTEDVKREANESARGFVGTIKTLTKLLHDLTRINGSQR